MYYDNKLGFYFKQYGTQIVVGIVCLIIVISGLFLYFKINDNTQQNTTVTANTQENNVETDNQTNVTEDDSILPEELRNLSAGQKTTVKVATVEDECVLTLIAGNQRIKAKLIGADYSKSMPDTLYLINQDLEGTYVDIAFDESKVSNGYAMVYVYTDQSTLYNAKILKEGKLVLDSTMNKKALEYNSLAESQAYAKQTLAGVWGE